MPEPSTSTDPLAAFRLDGRVAIVTGASSGLGARFARGLDAAGGGVVLRARVRARGGGNRLPVPRRPERLEALASELDDALPVRCDLQDTDALDDVVRGA